MKKITVLLAAILAGCCIASARQLSVDEALAGALGSTSVQHAPGNAASYRLAYTASQAGLNTLYVVSRSEGGYMVLAADDVAPALLGYSDEGTFNPADIPPAMQGWLDQYSAQIGLAAERGGMVLGAPANPALPDVAPITRTRWNQDAPYNNYCPTVNGQETYTGCVATAMAQVMKVYEWPRTGQGVNSYDWNGKRLSFDFGATTFNWADMADVYNGEQTAEQNDAVATLMYAAGISCNMNYGTGSSGALSLYAGLGLVTYLGYDKSARLLSRDYYPLTQWCEMLHEELAQGHALYYDGANRSAGHAFVIDGYNKADGFFHVNWGWGGISDGYYMITTLDPDSQGIGGSTAGYALGQSAIFGLKPDEGGNLSLNFNINGDALNYSKTFPRSDGYIEIGNSSSDSGFYNFSLGTAEVTYGFVYKGDDGEEHWAGMDESVRLDVYYGYTVYYVSVSGLPTSGRYIMRPAVRRGDDIQVMPAAIGCVQSMVMECNANEIRLSPVAVDEYNLSIESYELLSPFYRGQTAMVNVTLSNSGEEYYGYVNLNLLANGRSYSLGEAVADIIDGATETVTFIGNLPGLIPLGEAQLEITDQDGNLVGDRIDVQVEKAPTGNARLSMRSARFLGVSGGDGSDNNPYVVDPADIQISAAVDCVEGYFVGNVVAFVFDASGSGSSSTYIQSSFSTITEGQTADFVLKADLSSRLISGHHYFVQFFTFEDNDIGDVENNMTLYFDLGTSGIDDIEGRRYGIFPNPVDGEATVSSEGEIRSIEIYNVAGLHMASYKFDGTSDRERISFDNLSTGHYFVRIVNADGTYAVKRLIKR